MLKIAIAYYYFVVLPKIILLYIEEHLLIKTKE